MENALTISPIVVIHSGMRLKYDAPSQPIETGAERNTVELFAHRGFEKTLKDLEGFDRVWLIWWFDRNKTWKPRVMPPRGNLKRVSLFATRSPHRPNPIGMTSTPLYKVDGLKLIVGAVDLMDQTPILDIKPYIPAIDSFPGSKTGWLAEIEAADAQPPAFTVGFSDLCRTQLDWLKQEWNVDFLARAIRILERDPAPHRTRRISRYDRRFRIGCGAWRMLFSVDGSKVLVEEVKRGYPQSLLQKDESDRVPDREAQLAFEKRWPDLKDVEPLPASE